MILRLVFGLIRWLLILALLVAAAGFAWYHRDALRNAWNEWSREPEGPVAPSAALADTVADRLALLARGGGPNRVALAEVEVQSFVNYRLMERLETRIIEPAIQIGDGRLLLTGRVAVDDLGPIGRLEELVPFLPDTTDIVATVRMVPSRRGRVALEVVEITAAKVPLPERLIPGIVRSLTDASLATDLPANFVVLPLPHGARAAYLSGDSLVFLAGASGVAIR